MRCRGTIVALLLLTLAPAAHAAQKTPRFHQLGMADSLAITDGQREVAFLDHAPTVRVYDFGTQPPAEQLVNAPFCGPRDVPVAGALEAVGAGKVGWNCNVPFGTPPALTDLATGAVTVMSNTNDFFNQDGAGPLAIGRRWVKVFVKPHIDPEEYWYYDLATDTIRRESSSPRKYPSLDTPRLFQTMCAPLRRTGGKTYPNGPEPVYDPYFYTPPFGVGVRPDKRRELTGGEVITVQRCGSRRPSIIGRCTEPCPQVGVSAGIVTWADSHALRAYVLRTHRQYSWPLSHFGGTAGYLIHTRQRLIASVAPQEPGGKWAIWAARVPKR